LVDVLINVAIIFGLPFLGLGLAVVSMAEILGKVWHKPYLVTRLLGVVGLLASALVVVMWLMIVVVYKSV